MNVNVWVGECGGVGCMKDLISLEEAGMVSVGSVEYPSWSRDCLLAASDRCKVTWKKSRGVRSEKICYKKIP